MKEESEAPSGIESNSESEEEEEKPTIKVTDFILKTTFPIKTYIYCIYH